MRMSLTRTSGRRRSNSVNASSGEATATTLAPASSSTRVSSRRTPRSSSTTRMRRPLSMRRAYQRAGEIEMIDAEFLVELQRSPEALLAEYELNADERATILQALARLTKLPSGQRRHEFHNALIRRVST